jgi:hypothetical protein
MRALGLTLCGLVLAGCSPVGVGFTTGEATPAPSSGGRLVLIDSGIDFAHSSAEPRPNPTTSGDYHLQEFGAGIVSGDWDGDGAPDLWLPQGQGPSETWWGRGDGTFERGESGAELAGSWVIGGSTADFDGDGDLDLLALAHSEVRLLRNEGGRAFVDVTGASGLGADDGLVTTSAWADWDGDGDLDLYLGGYAWDTPVYRLPDEPYEESVAGGDDGWWRNEGDGTFVPDPTAPQLGLPWDGLSLHAVFEDLDDDGDPDLIQLNDYGGFGQNSRLWERTAEGWVDRMADSGLGVLPFPMGAAIQDLDGDGLIDLFVSDIGRPTVARGSAGSGGFEFTNTSLAWFPEELWDEPIFWWSVVPIDVDGEGEPGLFVTAGPTQDVPPELVDGPEAAAALRRPDRFFRRGASGWRSVPVLVGDLGDLDRGVVIADFDGDLHPDLAVAGVGAPIKVLRLEPTGAARLVVSLRDGSSANTRGVGARVTVEADGVEQIGYVRGGGPGTFSGSEPDLFFGLGEATTARITVRWPDGQLQVIDDACACRVVVER